MERRRGGMALMNRLFLMILFCASLQIEAAIRYVRTDGHNTASGANNTTDATTGAWQTIQKAASTISAGDTARVQAGLYDEKPVISLSGSAGLFKNFVADGVAICRGFDIQADYIRVSGFEIFHTNTSWGRGIELNGVHSHIEIIDNYIHNTFQSAIQGRIDSQPTYVTIRGNRIEEVGIITGVATNGTSALGNSFSSLITHHWLVEYNTFNWSIDFVNVFGTNMLVRNNSLRNFSNTHFGVTDSEHSDIFQPSSDGSVTGTRNQNYERNFAGDSIELNSHFGIWQDTVAAGDTNILIRGNVGFNFGSGAIGNISTDHLWVYHNTFYLINTRNNGAPAVLNYKSGAGADFPLNCGAKNNIVALNSNNQDGFQVANGATASYSTNIGYFAGSNASYVSTSDPLFVSTAALNFRLQSLSPAVNAASAVTTITSASGSGTTFNVGDGQMFIDGWGMTDGDIVTVGGTATHIVSLSGNAMTVADSVTWVLGQPVYWGSGAAPDIGAFPLGSTELTAAYLTNSGTIYTATTAGDARHIWFYVDGIPAYQSTTAPYVFTNASGVVTAKAYALYAQNTPVVTAAGAPPTPPTTNTTVTVTGQPGSKIKGRGRLK